MFGFDWCGEDGEIGWYVLYDFMDVLVGDFVGYFGEVGDGLVWCDVVVVSDVVFV